MMSVGNLFRSYFMIAKYPKQRSDCLLLVRQILAQRKTTQIEVVASYSIGAPGEVPKNPLSEINSASDQTENGIVYDKKPFKMRCEKGKNYAWCLCGRSKNQPLCDGTHKSPYLKVTQRPIRFQVTEDKEYWLCNCKQTSNRPFCDGSHKREDVQAVTK